MNYTDAERDLAKRLARELYEGHHHDPRCLCALCLAWTYLFSVGSNKGFNNPRLDNPRRENA